MADSPQTTPRQTSKGNRLTLKSRGSRVIPTLGAILCSVFFWSRRASSATAALSAATTAATSSIAANPAATLSQVGTAIALVYYSSVVAMKQTASPHLANTLGKSLLQACGSNAGQLYFFASLILSPVLATKLPFVTAAYMAATGGLATYHATRQLEYSYKGLKRQMLFSINGALALIIGLSMGLDLLPGKNLAHTWIPVVGLLMGHTATSVAHAANAWTRELRQQHDAWEWRVARGATWKEASAPLLENAYRAAWTPLMKAMTLSMGLWQLPALMSGQLIASSILTATQMAMQQIIVWCLTATTVSTAVQGLMHFMMRSTVDVEAERLRLGIDGASWIRPVEPKDPWWRRAQTAVSSRIRPGREEHSEKPIIYTTPVVEPLGEQDSVSVMYGAKSTGSNREGRHLMNGGAVSADELNIFEDSTNSHLKFLPGMNQEPKDHYDNEEPNENMIGDTNYGHHEFHYAGVDNHDTAQDPRDNEFDSNETHSSDRQSVSSLLKLERSVFANGPTMARYYHDLKKDDSEIAEEYGVYNPSVLKLEKMPVDRAQVAISFDLHARDIVGIRGPSGIGKSQFLRTVAGLESMDRSTVSIFGQSACKMTMAQWRKSVAYVPQEAPTTLEGTPADFFEQALGFASQQSGSGMNAQSLAMMDLSTLLSNWDLDPEIINNPWASLSNDESQRIMLAISIALKPAVLLLDDSFSHLGEDIALTIENSLRALQIPIMMISNDSNQIKRMCNHVIDLAPASPAAFASSEGFE